MRRQRSTSLVAGYGRPEYSAEPAVKVQETFTTAEEEDMPQSPEDVVSEYRWPGGPVVRLTRSGSVRCYGAPFYGSIHDIPAEGRKNWTEGEGVVVPVNANDPAAGYTVYDIDANMIAGFTPEWAKANLP